LRFVLISADADLDFTEANLDLAVRLADGPGEHEGVQLGDGAFVTVAIAGAPELPIGWPGCPLDEAKGGPVTLADAGLALAAAAPGIGGASVPALLAESDVAAGRVTVVSQKATGTSYWLIAPLPQWRQKKVRALVAALTG